MKLVELPTCQQLIVQHEMLQDWDVKGARESLHDWKGSLGRFGYQMSLHLVAAWT